MYNNIDNILNSIRNSNVSVKQISIETKIRANRIYSWLSNESKPKAEDFQKLINWYEKLKTPKEQTFNKLQREIINNFIEYRISIIQSKISATPMPLMPKQNVLHEDGPEPTIESLQYQVEVLINQVAIARLEIIKQQQIIETLQKNLSDKDYIIEMQKKLLL